MNVLDYLNTNQEICKKIAEKVNQNSGKAYLVGGCVRDALLGVQSHDIDIEVFGIDIEKIISILDELKISFDEVGKSFGILKLRDYSIDIALPRTEEKTGIGHKGFTVKTDPFLELKAATLRRDFTINAILWDIVEEKLLDFNAGEEDLKNRILRHTSEKFSEDPLRVLRAMQLIARFNLDIAQETLELCQEISIESLPKERIYEEWKKLLLKGVYISKGLNFLRDCGWVEYFPELKELIGCPQHQIYHPEGDVWNHTGFCLDAFAKIRKNNDEEDIIVGFGVLCHDLGKPLTTVKGENGIYQAHGHEAAGIEPTVSFIKRISDNSSLLGSVKNLVLNHSRPSILFEQNRNGTKVTNRAIRRLLADIESIERQLSISVCDMNGRPPIECEAEAEELRKWLMQRVEELQLPNNQLKPIIQGRHLIELGLEPGKNFKQILDQTFEAQIEGDVLSKEDGLKYVQKLLERI